jgi:ABC-type multidrug transport system fused ATPase/permease subunit
LLQALLNFAGLAVLIPLLALILQGIDSSPFLLKLRTLTHIPDENTFAIALCIVIFGFISGKNVLSVLLRDFQVGYVNRLYRYYSEKLYCAYYQRGLLFLKSNPTTLSHKINRVCFVFAQDVLLRIFNMAGDTVLLLFIWIALGIYSFPIAMLCILCLAPTSALYFFYSRKSLVGYGRAENEVRRKQARIVAETWKGYPEIQSNHAFPYFFEQFQEGLGFIAYYRKHANRITSLPGAVIETGVAGSLIIFALVGKGNASMTITFGLFAIAALRMLPAIRNLITGWAQLKNNAYATEAILDAMAFEQENQSNPTASAPLTFRREIKIDRLGFRFPDAKKESPPVLNNFSLTVSKGERIGIQGPSGIGKSTLFNLLMGFYPPSEGEIRIDGRLLDASTRKSWYDLTAYVPQEVFIMHGSLAENVALGKNIAEIDRDKVLQVLEQVRLKTYAESLPQGIDTLLGENGSRLSGGERQRVGIARALYKQAEVIFFDEATSSLDAQTEKEITEAIQSLSEHYKDLSILMIAHRESSLSFCGRIVRI